MKVWADGEVVPGFTGTFAFVPAIDFFEGLPLLAQGSDDKIEVEITVPPTGLTTNFYADGRFFRS